MIEVVPLQAEHVCAWKQFLQASNNGTLFHDLDFLAYHPPARFESHHLLFRQGGQILALLPAVIVAEGDEQRYLKSHDGASVGGFVLPPGQGVGTTLALIECLQAYVRAMGLNGIEMRIAPHIYMREPDEHLSFALAATGFRLVRRWLTHAIPLPHDPDTVLTMLADRKVRYIRAARRRGVVAQEVGVEVLERMYDMLCRNRAKQGAVPTHSLSELRTLVEKVPRSIRLFCCFVGSAVAASALVFEANPSVAYTFYLCHESSYEPYRPTLLLGVHIAMHYAARKFRYLDLGPTTFNDFTLNGGLAFFKEGLGAKGFCRDSWRWDGAA